MNLPETARAVVFDPQTRTLDMRELPLRPPRRGEVLVRVSLSAICGSDLHTISGRRDPGGALVLGHEICGTVAALGEGVEADSPGRELAEGDRLTWSIAASCGGCFYCARDLPQKCVRLFKYGHAPLDGDTPLSGGFAEYCYLVPGTTVLRLPDDLPNPIAVFANCSLATMAAAVRRAEVSPGQSVLIQGAGLVGLCAAALCADRNAAPIVVVDPREERRERAGLFGATHTADPRDADAVAAALQEVTVGERGFDVAIEACGQPQAIAQGLDALRTGGTYVLAGCVFPGARVEIDAERITRGVLRVIGQHNYAPRDLQDALEFLRRAQHRFSFGQVVEAAFGLDDVESALAYIEAHPEALRVAIEP